MDGRGLLIADVEHKYDVAAGVRAVLASAPSTCSEVAHSLVRASFEELGFDVKHSVLFVQYDDAGFDVESIARVDLDIEFSANYVMSPKPGDSAVLAFLCTKCGNAAHLLGQIERYLAKKGYEFLQVQALTPNMAFYHASGFKLWLRGQKRAVSATDKGLTLRILEQGLALAGFRGKKELSAADAAEGAVMTKVLLRSAPLRPRAARTRFTLSPQCASK